MSRKRVPPSTNRGVQNTSKSGLEACVDWVQVTFKKLKLEQLVEEVLLLDMRNFRELGCGALGYKKCIHYGNIRIYYDGALAMGIHLEMKGNGCREYESKKKASWDVLFNIMLLCEGNFTRLDLAIDDYDGYFEIEELWWRYLKKDLYVSKFKTFRFMDSIKKRDPGGVTVYLGSSDSDIQVRFYEKSKEQGEEGVWNRTEIQLRDDRAQMVALKVSEGGCVGDIVKGVLKNYMRFLVKGKDSNRSRWKTAKFWEKFLGDIEKLKLVIRKPDMTIEKKIGWLRKQVSVSIATVIQALDGDMKVFYEMISEGSGRMQEKDHDMVREYKESEERKECLLKEFREERERLLDLWIRREQEEFAEEWLRDFEESNKKLNRLQRRLTAFEIDGKATNKYFPEWEKENVEFRKFIREKKEKIKKKHLNEESNQMCLGLGNVLPNVPDESCI